MSLRAGTPEGGREPGLVELVDESFHLLHALPAAGWACHLAGMVPLILGVCHFTGEMSYSAGAGDGLAAAALILALLYLWMIAWRVPVARMLHAAVEGPDPAAWDRRRAARAVLRQCMLQPWALLALPAAMVLVFPAADTAAFFQNLLALEDGRPRSLRGMCREAAQLAQIRRGQVFFLLWSFWPGALTAAALLMMAVLPAVEPLMIGPMAELAGSALAMAALALVLLNPFCLALAVNLAAAAAMLPALANTLFGVQTVYVQAGGALENNAFQMLVVGLVWLCAAPVLAAAHTLRCHYGRARRNGADLLAELRRGGAGVVLAACCLAAFCGGAAAQEPPAAPAPGKTVDPAALDLAVRGELAESIYSWRMPKTRNEADTPLESGLASFFGGVLDATNRVLDAVDKVWERIRKWLWPDREGEEGGGAGGRGGAGALFARPAMILLLVLLLAALAAAVWLRLRARRAAAQAAQPPALAPAPDVADEAVGAEALPEDEWVVLARQLTARGEFRLALRAAFLAVLAGLARRELVRLARHKSNREYARELDRYAHVSPALPGLFRDCLRPYESVWYGAHAADGEMVERMIAAAASAAGGAP